MLRPTKTTSLFKQKKIYEHNESLLNDDSETINYETFQNNKIIRIYWLLI